MREFLYGRQAVVETLRAGRRKVFKLFVAENVQDKGTLAESLSLAARQGVPVQHVPRAQLDKLNLGHQGIAAEVGGYPYTDLDAILSAGKNREGRQPTPLLVLVLDCVQDPQNLGTLLRTAEAAGVDGVIFPEHRAASITPAVVNASSGAVEHLRVARVTNVTNSLKALQEADVWIAGLEFVPEAQLYTQADLTGALALVVGSEGQGMSRLVKETCDFIIRLPMYGKVGSLNVAVAGSIALYEVLRQRGQSVSQKPSRGG
jgi:23S rRNA (guanosine2251-2'-O)-methyltransferase